MGLPSRVTTPLTRTGVYLPPHPAAASARSSDPASQTGRPGRRESLCAKRMDMPRSEVRDHPAVSAGAEVRVGFLVDELADEAHRAVAEDEVDAPGVLGLEPQRDGVVGRAPHAVGGCATGCQ